MIDYNIFKKPITMSADGQSKVDVGVEFVTISGILAGMVDDNIANGHMLKTDFLVEDDNQKLYPVYRQNPENGKPGTFYAIVFIEKNYDASLIASITTQIRTISTKLLELPSYASVRAETV